MKVITLVVLLFAVYVVGAWVINLVKFTECDFSIAPGTSLKCEVVHGIGLVPVISLFTSWATFEE